MPGYVGAKGRLCRRHKNETTSVEEQPRRRPHLAAENGSRANLGLRQAAAEGVDVASPRPRLRQDALSQRPQIGTPVPSSFPPAGCRRRPRQDNGRTGRRRQGRRASRPGLRCRTSSNCLILCRRRDHRHCPLELLQRILPTAAEKVGCS